MRAKFLLSMEDISYIVAVIDESLKGKIHDEGMSKTNLEIGLSKAQYPAKQATSQQNIRKVP
jgi:hypothetical protein